MFGLCQPFTDESDAFSSKRTFYQLQLIDVIQTLRQKP